MIKWSKSLHKLKEEKGLYNLIEAEYHVSRTNRIELSDETREAIKRFLIKEGWLEPEEAEETTIYTMAELIDYLEDLAKQSGVPENYLDYINYPDMIYDMITGGDLSYALIEKDGVNFMVFWFK